MTKRIHVLEPQVAELIAAGEVVERPASIVKELLENAVDAGAQKITVEIKNGGISYIRVTDDGDGIAKEDLPSAFIRHATSKVRTADDLDQIASFGFRGEALASIAAVCKVEILSRTPGSISGGRYVIHGSQEVDFSDAGCPVGTTIVVRDVFFNTPARMKFLKKDSTEANTIANIVDKVALANPQISFRFIRDGQVKLNTPGNDDLRSVIYAVYGKEFAEGMIPVSYTHEFVSVNGFICRPTASRSTRSMQSFFINSRYVRSRTCMAALEEAYKSSIMTGKFPSCVLNVQIPFNTVDVNVHPAKIEVRFSNERPVFDAVYRGCKEALGTAGEADFLPKEETPKAAPSPFSLKDFDHTGRQQRMTAAEYRQMASSTKGSATVVKSEPVMRPRDLVMRSPSLEEAMGVLQQHRNETAEKSEPQMWESRVMYAPRTEERPEPVKKEQPTVIQQGSAKPWLKVGDTAEPESHLHRVEESQSYCLEEQEEHNHTAAAPVQLADDAEEQTSDYKILGELFGTYIMVEYRDTFVLVDKHAAHERILYNRLCRETSLGQRQILLAPVPVTLSRQEYDAALQGLSAFEQIGFLLEDFGNGTVLVREIPTMLPMDEVTAAVQEATEKLLDGRQKMLPETVEELLHSVACKAAIKAHDTTSLPEMEQLVEVIRQDRDVRFCPHGRPVSITMTRSELERRFGRLV